MHPPHRSVDDDGAAIALRRPEEVSVLVDAVRGEEEVVAEPLERDAEAQAMADDRLQRALVVVVSRSQHVTCHRSPEVGGFTAESGEHGATRDAAARVHAVGVGDVHGGVSEEREGLRVGEGTAGEDVRVEHEGELEGEIGVVQDTCVPLLRQRNQVRAVHGDEHVEQSRGAHGKVAVGHQGDVRSRLHRPDHLARVVDLVSITRPTALARVRVEHHALLEERRGGRRKRGVGAVASHSGQRDSQDTYFTWSGQPAGME